MGPKKPRGKYLSLIAVAALLVAALPAAGALERDTGPAAPSIAAADQVPTIEANTLVSVVAERRDPAVGSTAAVLLERDTAANASAGAAALPAERETLAMRFGERERANTIGDYDLCTNALAEPPSTDARAHRSHVLRA